VAFPKFTDTTVKRRATSTGCSKKLRVWRPLKGVGAASQQAHFTALDGTSG